MLFTHRTRTKADENLGVMVLTLQTLFSNPPSSKEANAQLLNIHALSCAAVLEAFGTGAYVFMESEEIAWEACVDRVGRVFVNLLRVYYDARMVNYSSLFPPLPLRLSVSYQNLFFITPG